MLVAIDAPRALRQLYGDAYPEAVRNGIPLHVTLLFPFVQVDGLGAVEESRLRDVVAGQATFDFALTRVETFPEHVWLAPEPVAPFAALTTAIHAAFPAYAPYEGAFAEVIHHATLARVQPGELDATVATLQPKAEALLPVELRATEVTLLAEDPTERWSVREVIPLGAST